MAGSPEENGAPHAGRSSNASSSSSSSSSSDDDTAEAVGEPEGGPPPEEAGVDATSSGIVNAQEQRHQHKESDAEEAGRLNLGGHTTFILMVAGVVAVAIAAAFVVHKKR